MLSSVMMQLRNNSAQLVQEHLGFARSLVRRMALTLPPHADSAALESDALLGLLLAARSFDPARGVAFTTFAARRICGAMLDGLRQRQDCSRGQRPPVMVSLATPVYDNEGVTVGDLLPSSQDPVGAALERQDQLDHLLRHITPSARKMVLEYIVDGVDQGQIGRRHGLSSSRVSQRIKVACQRMREAACVN